MIIPQTEVRLLNVDLELDNKNQLTFNNINEQLNYFSNLNGIEFDNFTFQRENNTIRIPASYEYIYTKNYCMYKNDAYENKWFYAFINNVKYINDNMTEVSITTDVFQTWMFDYTIKESFVEREIVEQEKDIAGNYTIDEQLDIGEVVTNYSELTFNDTNPYFVIAYTGDTLVYNNITINIPKGGLSINGIPSAVPYIICNTITDYNSILQAINEQGTGNNVITCFTIPQISFIDHFIKYKMNNTTDINAPCCIVSRGTYSGHTTHFETNKPTNIIDGYSNGVLQYYTPVNKKMLTYPYMYLATSAPDITNKIYKYENFDLYHAGDNKIKFDIFSEFNPNPSLFFQAINYNGNSNIAHSSVMTGYPTLAYSNDVFNTWLAQNQEIMDLNMSREYLNYGKTSAGNILEFLGGASSLLSGNSGGITKVGASLVSQVNAGIDLEYFAKNQMATKNQVSLLPDEINIGSSATLIGFNKRSNDILVHYNIKPEFYKRIDKYFSMFGYTINEVKIPNTNSRPNWNYLKTSSINLTGDIPQSDIEILKSIYNSGVTLWHNPETFLDYSQSNII